MNQAMSFSRDIISKFELVFLSKKWEPGKVMQFQINVNKIVLKAKNKQHAVDKLWRYILFFFNFKSNHVILCPDAVRNNVWLHAAASVVASFNILLVLGPALVQC